MERTRLGRFIDNTALTLLAVIFSFLFFKQYIANNIYCLTFALFFGFAVLKLILHIQNKKYTKLSIQKQEVADIEKYNFALRKLSREKQIDFFNNMLNDKKTTPHSRGIILENKVFFFLCLEKDMVCPENVYEAYIEAQNIKEKECITIEEIAIICNKISPESMILVKTFKDINFTIFSPIETFALLKKFNYFPKLEEEKTQKVSKFSFIKQSFVKKQAKVFFKCAVLIYISSLFVPFTKYYLVTAGICMLISGICYCFGSKEIPISPLSKKLLYETQE